MKKAKLGIVGLGRLGRRHAENIAFRVPNAELGAACSVIPDEIKYAKENLGVTQCYEDFREMIKNKDLDAIFIASSSTEHHWMIESALDAGFHVFSEKPLGVTVEECKKVEKVVEKHPDKVFMLGFMRRYDESYIYAKKKIDEGFIGKPYLIRATSIDPENYVDLSIRFAPTGGGLFLDMTVHDIDLARWFLGKPEPKSVYAIGGSYLHQEFAQYNDADNAVSVMQFKDESMAMFYSGRDALHGYHVETEIVGTKGTLRISAVPQKNLVQIFNEHGCVQECVPYFPERFERAYLAELQEFVDCIVEGRRPDVTVYDGTKSTEIAYKMTESFRKNQLIFF